MALTQNEVRELLLQLFPPGRLYDWRTRLSNVSRFLDALADTFLPFGYGLVDRLRREISPATAVEKLPDWEQALGIDGSYTARNGTIAQRQAAVVGKLREFGALTLANARAILAPLLGYADSSKLVILETDRAKMRAAHTYTDGQSYGAAQGISASTVINDGGLVSRAGAQLDLLFAAVPTQPFVVTLTSPTYRQKTWAPAMLQPWSAKYRLFAPEFAGDKCAGIWQLGIQALSFLQQTTPLQNWSVFVEGTGPSGLGGDVVAWGPYLDPALASKNGTPADVEAAHAAISRVKPAHSAGFVITSLAAIPDDPTSVPDACLPA
jgi:uncharacterized protein YmfQ (DUF2313 family)